jgi:hypothetical protein
MMRDVRAKRVVGVVIFGTILALFFGCSAVLGLGDYNVGPTDSGLDANPDQTGEPEGGEAGCGVDITKVCYPCDPTTNEQFLNSCPDNNCIPFDSTRLTGLLLPDGGLPPLDGG